MTSSAKSKGRFGKQDFVYLPEEDAYRCPAGEKLRYYYSNVERGLTLRRYWTTACHSCPLKSRCTTGPQRRITRWEHEDVLEAVQRRLDLNPGAMRQRRETVEHPFGTIKTAHGRHPLPDEAAAEGERRDGAARAGLQSHPGAEHPGHPAADGRPQGIGAGLCPRHQACEAPDTRFRGDWSLIPSTISQLRSPMMVKGFGAWKAAIRLLPKRFDTTKTRC